MAGLLAVQSGKWGAYMRDTTTYVGTLAKSGGGVGRNCRILRYSRNNKPWMNCLQLKLQHKSLQKARTTHKRPYIEFHKKILAIIWIHLATSDRPSITKVCSADNAARPYAEQGFRLVNINPSFLISHCLSADRQTSSIC